MKYNPANVIVPILAIILIAKTTQNTLFTIVSGLALGSFLASVKNPRTRLIGTVALTVGLIIGFCLIPKALP